MCIYKSVLSSSILTETIVEHVLHVLRWEFMKENKKVRKQENMNSFFFLSRFLGRALFSYFLLSFINSHLWGGIQKPSMLREKKSQMKKKKAINKTKCEGFFPFYLIYFPFLKLWTVLFFHIIWSVLSLYFYFLSTQCFLLFLVIEKGSSKVSDKTLGLSSILFLDYYIAL